MGKREQPLSIAITTAGCGRLGIAWELYSYAKRVQAGEIEDPTFLPVLLEPPEGFDWRDPAVWAYVNPALGIFRSLEEMETMARRAEHVPAMQAAFRQLYLDEWREGSSEPWIDLSVYDQGEIEIGLDDIPAGARCWCGLDLSTTTDLSCLAILFDWEDRFLLIPRFYAPAEGIRRRGERDGVAYPLWATEGWLTPTPGSVVDYGHIEQQVHELAERFDVRQIAVDRWNSTMVVTRLQEAGLPVVLHGQGYASMSGPSKELEKLILEEKLKHDPSPIMRWCLGNTALARDAADNIKPDKAKSKDRIDGVTAAVMAVAVAAVAPAGSVYESRPSFLVV